MILCKVSGVVWMKDATIRRTFQTYNTARFTSNVILVSLSRFNEIVARWNVNSRIEIEISHRNIENCIYTRQTILSGVHLEWGSSLRRNLSVLRFGSRRRFTFENFYVLNSIWCDNDIDAWTTWPSFSRIIKHVSNFESRHKLGYNRWMAKDGRLSRIASLSASYSIFASISNLSQFNSSFLRLY